MQFMLQKQQKTAATTSLSVAAEIQKHIVKPSKISIGNKYLNTLQKLQIKQQQLQDETKQELKQQNRFHNRLSSISSQRSLDNEDQGVIATVPSIRKQPRIELPAHKAATTSNCITSVVDSKKMEHSYTRDNICPTKEVITGLAPARTIFVRRPAQCPSCHPHPLEDNDFENSNQVSVPAYNEIAAKEAMNECLRIANYVKNQHSDDEDWENHIQQIGWSQSQITLFTNMVKILDTLQLGRLAYEGRPNEPMYRRIFINKAAKRLRKAMSTIEWDPNLTQWLHALLMENLPPTYMALYLDILQTLKTRLPSLVDKMLFGRQLNISQELLAPVMKKQWEPTIPQKLHKALTNCVFVALASVPVSGPVPPRTQSWYNYFNTIAPVVTVTLPITSSHVGRQPLDMVAEQIVCLTRVKIQELRSEDPSRSIVLLGFNAGAALAIQAALSESVAAVVCMGFAYHTLNGERGGPDDRILDLKTPILFVVGQNSARGSPEEMEYLREKMQSQSALVIVGNADDQLRMSDSHLKIETTTQHIVDVMVVDEVYDFLKKTFANPPGPRIPTSVTSILYPKNNKLLTGMDVTLPKVGPLQRKRKLDMIADTERTPKSRYVTALGRPRTRPLVTSNIKTVPTTSTPISNNSKNTLSNDDLSVAMQSILSDESDVSTMKTNTDNSPPKIITNFELVAPSKTTSIKSPLINSIQKSTVIGGSTPAICTKIKMIPSNQFMQLKPTTKMQSQSKIYTIKPPVTVTPVQGSGANIGGIVKTTSNSSNSPQQHIFTLKSPSGQTTQFVTAAPASGVQKYTMVKNATGGTTLQLTTPSTSAQNNSDGTGVDLSNIIDMPIIFADNDGNFTETVDKSKSVNTATTIRPSTSSGVGKLIINQKIIKEATNTSTANVTPTAGSFSITKPNIIVQQPGMKSSKVVLINRSAMKSCPSTILTRPLTKVLVNSGNPNATTIVSRANIQGSTTIGNTATITKSVNPINFQALNPKTAVTLGSQRQSGIINVGTKTFQILNASPGTTIANSTGTVTGDIPAAPQIILKPGALKQIPDHLRTQLLNRNLTVRKLVNIVPATQQSPISVTVTGSNVSTATVITSSPPKTHLEESEEEDTSSSTLTPATATSSPSAIQTSPKIITLNPINPSAVTATTISNSSSAQSSSD